MRPSLRVVAALVIGLCMAPHCLAASGQAGITVFFVPLDVETYVPITPETIMSQAWEKWAISPGAETSRLLQLLSPGTKGTFDANRTRVMIIFKRQVYCVDSNGVARAKSGSDFRIDKSALAKFRDSLPARERQILKSQPLRRLLPASAYRYSSGFSDIGVAEWKKRTRGRYLRLFPLDRGSGSFAATRIPPGGRTTSGGSSG